MMEQPLDVLTSNRLAVVIQLWENPVQFWGLGFLKLMSPHGAAWLCHQK